MCLSFRFFFLPHVTFWKEGSRELGNINKKGFAEKQGDGGLLYVYKTTDEKTKNHEDDSTESFDGRR
jgi:hypothetical protein